METKVKIYMKIIQRKQLNSTLPYLNDPKLIREPVILLHTLLSELFSGLM